MIQRADTIGVFQIESRAQMSMLPRLKPEEFYDLVIEVAIVRPGPIQGKMVHPYLQRREAPHTVTYPSPAPPWPADELEQVLGKTLGVPLFQEQAMRIAIVAAGFTPAEADRLRRAMATFRRVGTIGTFQRKMIEGMVAKGYEREFAERCFEQIEGFGEYGFPESHAASFAHLVYASCWLKCHYPDVFAAALLNSQPMGFYAPAQIVRDAQEHGVEVRDVDINASDWDCTLESGLKKRATPPPCLDAGRYPHHPRAAARLAPGQRPVRGRWPHDRGEARRRLRFDPRSVAAYRLAPVRAGDARAMPMPSARSGCRAATRSGPSARCIAPATRTTCRCSRASSMPEMEPDVALPPMLPGEQVVEDYRHLKLSLRAHPVSFLRADLDARGILRNETLTRTSSGRRVSIAGIVLIRQRPGTAKGVIFMTLEDETGIANTIVWPKVFETFRPVVLGARLVGVTGKLQNEKGVIHVVAEQIEDLTPLLRRLSEHGPSIESLARCDEVKRPDPGTRSAKNWPRTWPRVRIRAAAMRWCGCCASSPNWPRT